MTIRRLVGEHETALLLPAGLPLVFPEIFPAWAAAAAALWIGLLLVNRRLARGHWTHATPLDAPIVALAVTLPGAVAVARDTDAAMSRVESLFFAVALYYAVANGIRTPERVWSAVTWLLAAGMAVAAAGLATADWLEKLPGLSGAVAGLPRFGGAVPHPTLQAGVHPNELAGVLILFVPLAVACLWWPGAGRARGTALTAPPSLTVVALAALAVTVPVLVLTQSRGAWLGLGVALVAMAALRERVGGRHGRGRTLAVAVAAASVVALALPLAAYTVWGVSLSAEKPTGLPAIVGSAPLADSRVGRVALWRDVLELVGREPTTGVGLNNFVLEFGQRPEYQGFFVYAGIPHAHNVYLQSAVDYGLPGFAAVIGLMTTLAWAAWRSGRRLLATPLAPAVVGLAFGLGAYALHGLVDAVAIGAKPGFLMWAVAAVLVAARRGGHQLSAGPADVPHPATVSGRWPRQVISDAAGASRRRRRLLAAALAMWAATSAAGVAVAVIVGILPGLAVAGSGGAVSGWLWARRCDGWRDRTARETRRSARGAVALGRAGVSATATPAQPRDVA